MEILPEELLALCRSVTAKRPKTVIDHILEFGFITTEELKEQYGYEHPPRAIRDVREHGIPLETYRVVGKNNRKIAAYRLGKLSSVPTGKQSGRTFLSKEIKRYLIEKHGAKCFIYGESMPEQDLQIDHRIPYEVAGDLAANVRKNDDFMLLCGSANRAKSWTCEQCDNFKTFKKPEICAECYWAFPESYQHVAMRPERRLDILWQGNELEMFEQLRTQAQQSGKTMSELVKHILEREVNSVR